MISAGRGKPVAHAGIAAKNTGKNLRPNCSEHVPRVTSPPKVTWHWNPSSSLYGRPYRYPKKKRTQKSATSQLTAGRNLTAGSLKFPITAEHVSNTAAHSTFYSTFRFVRLVLTLSPLSRRGGMVWENFLECWRRHHCIKYIS